jgi:HEAT repeat protein
VSEIVTKHKETLLSALNDPDWRARMAAVDQLGAVEDDDLADALLEIVKDHHQDLNALNSALKLLRGPTQKIFKGISALMDDPEGEVRTYATLTLGLIGDPRAIPFLMRALDDPEKNVQFAAIEGLGRLRAVEAVERLLEILRGQDLFLIFPAIDALALIGDARPVPKLIEMLKVGELAEFAAAAVGALAGVEATPALAAYLDTSGADVSIAASALISIYQRSADKQEIRAAILANITALGRQKLAEAVLEDETVEFSSAEQYPLVDLALLLTWLAETFSDEERICKSLVKLLKYPNLRGHAVEGLKSCGALIRPELEEALMDPDQDLRYAAMQLVSENATSEDAALLEKTLQSEHAQMVALAAEGLARLGDQSKYELLLQILDSQSAHVRQSIIRALETLQHPSHNDHMLALLDNSNPCLREIAVQSLGRQQGYKYAARIMQALADPADNVRQAVVEVLPLIDDPQAFFTIEEVLREEDAGMRTAAVKALQNCPAEFALPLLHSALQDENYWVRIHACRSLSRHDRRESYDYLVEVTHDPMPPVRIAALEALSGLSGGDISDIVPAFLEDPNPDVRWAAERINDRLK